MSGFYSKVVAEIKVSTTGANVSDFVSKVQAEKRLNELEVQKTNAKNAIYYIENEEKALKSLLKDMEF